jgi:hypothetical protein
VMDVQISPFVSFPTNVIFGEPAWSNRLASAQYLCHNLYDVELNFHWPVLANGDLGPNHQTFRSMVAGHMAFTNGYYAFEPHSYSTNILQ